MFTCRMCWLINNDKSNAKFPIGGLLLMEFIGDETVLIKSDKSCIFPSVRESARKTVQHTRVTEVARMSRRGESLDPRSHITPSAVKAQLEPVDGVSFLFNYMLDQQKDEVFIFID